MRWKSRSERKGFICLATLVALGAKINLNALQVLKARRRIGNRRLRLIGFSDTTLRARQAVAPFQVGAVHHDD
jgi:hypothetical protein